MHHIERIIEQRENEANMKFIEGKHISGFVTSEDLKTKGIKAIHEHNDEQLTGVMHHTERMTKQREDEANMKFIKGKHI